MIKIIFVCLLVAFNIASNAQDRINAAAQVKEVTVYANGAELSSSVKVNLPKGSTTLFVQNVAKDLDLRSVQISGPDGITVLSISTQQSGEMEILNPIHRKLKDTLDSAISRREILMNKLNAAQGALKILNNDQLLGGGSKVELGDLTKLVDYYQVKVVELNANISSLKKDIASEDKAIGRLQDKIRVYTGDGGQLIIQMSNAKAIEGIFNISYMTYSANWEAYYDLRAKSVASPLEILYKARVTQFTGVDWKNVKLTLSTGNPSQNGDAPLLNPIYAQYYSNQGLFGQLSGRAAGVNVMQNRVQSIGTRAEMENSRMEQTEAKKSLSSPVATITENQLSAIFEIDFPYDIASNGLPHSVTLKEFSHPALFKYYAVPKLDKDAFLLAEIKDFEKLNLVPGEANILFENMFVGTSYINPAVTTDTLNLSMGRDKSISIKRERIMDEKSTQVSGGTKRQTYTYELRVRNTKSTAINMLLKDQFPISIDKSIEIDLVDGGGSSVNRETGVLTWMLNVKPAETQTYRFTFTVKYPKDRVVNFN
ncbi:DUF4139 domain-containing protein [Sphingobacterium bovistauri]|uniref:DUF4139 domain-containing protein n=1 Tax=Sphingobacterium bovistauri TaxID=2781959 RepID=A0ABS7Z704_9SPHI|nr:DUF4139 domain-containing protein [Sphingobacterium bovistauri]MCA5005971.1 DUF4139 domain-containing protein [Sphingobacterium bovistauri]